MECTGGFGPVGIGSGPSANNRCDATPIRIPRRTARRTIPFRMFAPFRVGSRRVQQLRFLVFGPVETSAGEGQNAQGRESRYCEKFYRQRRGFAESVRENLTKIESQLL